MHKVASEIIGSIKGDYRFAGGKEYFVVENSNSIIPVNFASSGQQEILWLLIQLYVLMLKKEKAFVIIEEPEAHLYPSLQTRVLNFISFFVNVNNSRIIITTHSPYILTAANILYKAGRLHEQGLRKEVDKIIGKNKCILPQKLNAAKLYFSDEQIKSECLINDLDYELKTELIDDISDTINEIYTKLYYLEVANDSSQ